MKILSTSLNFQSNIKNASKIKEVSAELIRMCANEHPMMESKYSEFVELGMDAPSYAKMALKKAEYDRYNALAKDLTTPRSEIIEGYKKIQMNLDYLSRKPEGMELSKKLRNDFPKTGFMRMAIIAGLSEASNELVPCARNKFAKKNVYRVFRMINKILG